MAQVFEQEDGDVKPIDNIHDKYLLKNVMWWWHGACDIATSNDEDSNTDEAVIRKIMEAEKGRDPDAFIGGKRGRAVAEDDATFRTGNKIMDMSAFAPMVAYKNVGIVSFGYKEWCDGLGAGRLKQLISVMTDHKKYLLADNTIRKYATFVDIYAELEATHLNLNEIQIQ